MKKTMIVLLTLALAATGAWAGKRITIKGSDTMVILGQRWAEEYIRPIRM